MSNKLEVGSPAPDFTALNQQGEPVRLADRFGQKIIVLYFYPKDFTAGCTMEVCGFRDHYEVFADAGADVMASAPTPRNRIWHSPRKIIYPSLCSVILAARSLVSTTSVKCLACSRSDHLCDRSAGDHPPQLFLQINISESRIEERRTRTRRVEAGRSVRRHEPTACENGRKRSSEGMSLCRPLPGRRVNNQRAKTQTFCMRSPKPKKKKRSAGLRELVSTLT